MTKFVIVTFTILVLFTIACFVAIFLDKTIPDSLIVSVFSTFTGELGGMLFKKIKDNDKKNKNKENNDYEA